MINNTESKKLYKVQSGVTEYPIGFPFQFNSDGAPQLAITIGATYLQLNYNCKLSEDKGTLILIPTEEEAEALTGPEDYSWMYKWVDAPLVITRDIPFVQESDYQLGRISAEQIEHDFDASVMRDQMLADKIGEHTVDVQAAVDAINARIDGFQQEYEEDITDIDASLAAKATKVELENAKTTLNAGIQGNAQAIQKTRKDYIEADSEIHKILNNHTSELTTLRGNQASLGDQVSVIESKIPESASETNPLITKRQLLDEELDIRDDLNETASELQSQITAQAAAIVSKQDKLTAGDNIIISNNVISATGAGGGAGLSFIIYDTLPETGESGIIYLVPKDGEAPDIYNEYVWITATQTFELIGSTQVDLTDYAKKEYVATAVSDRLPLSGGTLTGTVGFDVTGDIYSYVPIIVNSNGDALISVLSDGAGKTTSNAIRFERVSFVKLSADTIGGAYNASQYIYVKKIGSGKDASLLNVPDGTGTLARLEDLANIDALPDQTGNAGKVLTTDGEQASWQDPTGGTTITIKEYDE